MLDNPGSSETKRRRVYRIFARFRRYRFFFMPLSIPRFTPVQADALQS